jgi:hypothetical protein
MAAEEPKRPKARYAPGELEQVRKNLGDINPLEAKEISKKLGGEIGVERSVSMNPTVQSRRHIPLTRKSNPSAEQSRNAPARPDETRENRPIPGAIFTLPVIPQKEWKKMDAVMSSRQYRITMNFGILNWFLRSRKRAEHVLSSFVRVTIGNTISHMESLTKASHELQDMVPESYRKKILDEAELKFQLLKKVGAWKFNTVQDQYEKYINSMSPGTIVTLAPLVRPLYKMLMPLYFLGDQRGADMLRTILVDLSAYPDMDKNKLLLTVRKMAGEWNYLFQNSIPRMYPLLMRMCGYEFYGYPEFFSKNISRILGFLDITKYDLLLPQKHDPPLKKDNAEPGIVQADGEQSQSAPAEESVNLSGTEQIKKQQRIRLVDMGLKLLDQMFPEAGWLKLSSDPDFYPYFQPIFNFSDTYALLSPANPIQKIVTLLYILQDLFRGCRSIRFDDDLDADQRIQERSDSILLALEEWRVYQDILFEKYYSADLRDLVDHLYAQHDFIHSALGKKILSSLMWQAKFFYLPHLNYFSLSKLQYDFAYRPLCVRVTFLQNAFAILADRIDAGAKTKGKILGVQNPWDNYIFDIPGEISRRLDLLARAQKKPLLATNASIIKYTASILSVLDWWLNDPASPAYSAKEIPLYRSAGGAMPVFPPAVRDDQGTVFQRRIEQIELRRKNQNQ